MNQSAAVKYFGSAQAAVGQPIDWYLAKTGVPMQVVGVVGDIRNENPSRESKPEVFVDYRQMIARFARGQRAGRPHQRGRDRLAVVRDPHHRRSRGVTFRWSVRPCRNSIRRSASIRSSLPIACLPRRWRDSASTPLLLGLCGRRRRARGDRHLRGAGLLGGAAHAGDRRAHGAGRRAAAGARADSAARRRRSPRSASCWACRAAAGLSRYLQSLLFGIEPIDPPRLRRWRRPSPSVAIAACYLPARRATRVDPVVALR